MEGKDISLILIMNLNPKESENSFSLNTKNSALTLYLAHSEGKEGQEMERRRQE